MRLPLTPPQHLHDLAADGIGAGRRTLAMLPRVTTLLDTAEQLLDRIGALVLRIEGTEAAAQHTVAEILETQRRARTLLDHHGATVTRIVATLDDYLPTLHALRPTIQRLGETFEPADADALAASIRAFPEITKQLQDQIIPMLETLKPVAPELHELLATSRALNEIIGVVPGLGRAKRRAEEELEHDTHDSS